MDDVLSHILCDHIHKLNLTQYQKKIIKKIINCKTPALGHHLLECTNNDCSNTEEIYNSCKSIYCPKCQSYSQLEWIAKRMNEVLPVDYMHLVFPVPNYLRVLFQYNVKNRNEINFVEVKVLKSFRKVLIKNLVNKYILQE